MTALSRSLYELGPWWVAVVFVCSASLWWLSLLVLARWMNIRRIRPPRVVSMTRLVIFLAGLAWLVDVLFVPVVLVSLGGSAGLVLVMCVAATIVYFFRVNDRRHRALESDRY